MPASAWHPRFSIICTPSSSPASALAFCESVVMTVSTTMICDYFSGKSRERWLAGQTATASLSALAIIPLGGVLAANYGWHGPFYIYIYSLLLVAGVAIFIWEPP